MTDRLRNIEVFSGPACSYCAAARKLLDKHGLSFVEIDVSQPDGRAEFQARLPRVRSIPQVFADGEHIGGYDDLALRLG